MFDIVGNKQFFDAEGVEISYGDHAALLPFDMPEQDSEESGDLYDSVEAVTRASIREWCGNQMAMVTISEHIADLLLGLWAKKEYEATIRVAREYADRIRMVAYFKFEETA